MCDIPLGVSSERAPALPALADARLYIMYGNPQRRSASEVQDLRREGGRWLKEMREAVGLSQRQLAAKLEALNTALGVGALSPALYEQARRELT